MSDRYDDMGTAELLREMCRKLDAIEKQGAPKTVTVSDWPTVGTFGSRSGAEPDRGDARATMLRAGM